MALFGRQAQQRGSNRYLIEFKAGKMTMDGTLVKADPRKGMIYISKGDDDLLHFCWKDRSGTNAEDDLIIFPNEVEFKKVPQCTTGRVFVLKFKGSSRRLFYWMQESDTGKDEDTFKKISDYLAGKTPPRTGGGEASNLPADLQALGLDDSALQDFLGGVDRNQLLQMLGVSAGSSTGGGAGGNLLQSLRAAGVGAAPAAAGGTTSPTPASATRPPAVASAGGNANAARPAGRSAAGPGAAGTGGKPSNAGKIQLADLRSILGSVQPVAEMPEQDPVDWSPALTRTLLLPILSNPAFVSRLTPHLPQDPLVPHTGEEILATIQSPQFQQAIQAFSSAFESRQLGPLIHEFNLGVDAVQAAQNGDFKAFVTALQRNGNSSGSPSVPGGGSGGKPGNDDDEMSVD